MQIYKSILSFFFLAVYLLGQGNCGMPNCDLELETKNTHAHYHHEHAAGEEVPDDHIQHEDHLDEGFLDLLACVWSDFNSSTDNCKLYISSKIETNELSKFKWSESTILKVLSVLVPLNTSEGNTNRVIASNYQLKVDSPPVSQCPYRGPPVISC